MAQSVIKLRQLTNFPVRVGLDKIGQTLDI